MAVSVVMAVYNGEKYLKEQLDSIVSQLSFEDELIGFFRSFIRSF